MEDNNSLGELNNVGERERGMVENKGGNLAGTAARREIMEKSERKN